MLTPADEFPIHQTPEPIAYAGSDRNFYDRYFFSGYQPDLSSYFAVAFGTYPALNVVDAHFSVLRGDRQYNLHASRLLDYDRMRLDVGPISIEVLEPLRRIRVTVAGEHGTPAEGIAAELELTGRSFPIEEPRFTRRYGPRLLFDYTRLTQNVRWTGWIDVDGAREQLEPGAVGTRDRSWGIRPVGNSDAQPSAPGLGAQFYWLWTPTNLAERSVFFHVNNDADGVPWNLRAALCADGAAAGEVLETDRARAGVDFEPGTRYPRAGTVEIDPPGEPTLRLTYEPALRFQMRGLGYHHPSWGHGKYVAPLAVQREDIAVSEADPADPTQMHLQTLCRVRAEQDGRPDEDGLGIFESLVFGRYTPYGFTGLVDGFGASASTSAG